VSFLTLVSVVVHNSDSGGRLSGVAGGVFENPNDLAINIAINFPFCFAFFLSARGIRKVLWAGAMVVMLYAVMITYSRSGFLALALAVLLCLWEFGIKGRRWHLLVLAGLIMLGIPAASPHNYSERLQSIFLGRIHGSQDHGSAEARKELLETSIQTMVQHPLVGVGPGNFQVVTGGWKVAHNTYSELGAEAGIPALILFLLVLGAGFQSLRFAQKSSIYKSDKEFQILTGALLASFGAYLVGAFFSDTAYNLFPYFLISYTCGLRHIAELQSARATAPVEKLDLRTQPNIQSPTLVRFSARPSPGIRG
jgi:putative inorganic carbon (HCO3(-)) transporter